MPWSKVVDRLEYYIALADPEHAQRERDRTAEQRYVHVDTFSDGAATCNGKLDAKDAVDFEAAIASIAKTLPMPDDPQALLTAHDKTQIRRAAAVGELARSAFGQDVLPQHELVVHLDATDPALDPEHLEGATGAAWVEQWGSLLTEDLPRFLEGSKVTVRPVVDIRQLRAEGVRPGSRRSLPRRRHTRPNQGRQPRPAVAPGAPGEDVRRLHPRAARAELHAQLPLLLYPAVGG